MGNALAESSGSVSQSRLGLKDNAVLLSLSCLEDVQGSRCKLGRGRKYEYIKQKGNDTSCLRTRGWIPVGMLDTRPRDRRECMSSCS